jgi:hypothetical protein
MENKTKILILVICCVLLSIIVGVAVYISSNKEEKETDEPDNYGDDIEKETEEPKQEYTEYIKKDHHGDDIEKKTNVTKKMMEDECNSRDNCVAFNLIEEKDGVYKNGWLKHKSNNIMENNLVNFLYVKK